MSASTNGRSPSAQVGRMVAPNAEVRAFGVKMGRVEAVAGLAQGALRDGEWVEEAEVQVGGKDGGGVAVEVAEVDAVGHERTGSWSVDVNGLEEQQCLEETEADRMGWDL